MKAILPLALLVCACVDPTPGDLRLDPAPELEGETRAAAERVLAATGVDVFGGAYEVTLRLAPASAITPPPGAAPCPTCTWAGHFDGREILVNETVPADDRERTVLHEVLHALILQPGAHLPRGVEGVLSEQRTVDCLTAADLERVCARVACKRFVVEEGCK